MCIISCYIEEHDKLMESKIMQKEYLLNTMADIQNRYRQIKATKEENGYYFIEFIEAINKDEVYKAIDLLNYEAFIRGIYLIKENNVVKFKVSIAADLSSIRNFAEKLEEFLLNF